MYQLLGMCYGQPTVCVAPNDFDGSCTSCTAVLRRLVSPNRYFFGVRQDKVNGVEGSTVIPVGSQHSITTPLPFMPVAPKPTHLLSSLRHTNKSSNPFISSHFVVSILHIPTISLFFTFKFTSSSKHSLLRGY